MISREIVAVITEDCDATIRSVPGLLWNGDKTKKFDADFKYNIGGFCGLLTRIDTMLNHDNRLPAAAPYDWKQVSDSPDGRSFPEFFLSLSVGELEQAYCVLPAGNPYAVVDAGPGGQ